jgi:hypothetical protein
MKNHPFWHALHGRGETAETLATAICSARAHVTQVLNGSRRGLPTRRKLMARGLLTPTEIQLLGWEVPHGTKSHVEPLVTEEK